MRLTDILFSKIGDVSKRYSNLPDRYIKRVMEEGNLKKPPGKPQFRQPKKRTQFYFSVHRPWTNEFRMDNMSDRKPVLVAPVLKWNFFRGDRVEILTGPDKGKHGNVKDIIEERNWVIVAGLNTKLRLVHKGESPEGTVYEQQERPLLINTQVALLDPSDLKTTNIEWRYTESGELVRVSCRTGRVIPIPASHNETKDYKHPSDYKESAKDTVPEHVYEISFECALKTFEMDIMDKMGIKDNRVPKKYYWY